MSRDVSNTRAGGVSVGALNRLIGIEGAELLYATDPESYIKELESLEKLLKALDNWITYDMMQRRL